MEPVHVITKGHEFIGMVEQIPDGVPQFPLVIHDAVKLLYLRVNDSFKINLDNLKQNNKYIGCINLYDCDMIIMPLDQRGSLYRAYLQAKSSLVMAQPKMPRNIQKSH